MSFSTLCLRAFILTVGLTSFGCASLRYRASDPRRAPSAAPARPGQPDRRTLAPATPPLREELDVVYGRAGGEELKLDLFVPRNRSGPLPAVIFLHGGGWSLGSHEDSRPAARKLAEKGYVAAAVGYRLAPHHKFPAQIQDVKCAVRWLRGNAERYQIDGERIGVVGHSAGGHLALLVGLTEAKDGLEGDSGNAEQSSRVQVVVEVAGPTDLTRPDWPAITRPFLVGLLGGSSEQVPDAYRAASPLTYVHRNAPPVLIIHGTEDQMVPYEQAKLLHTALRRAGVPSRLEPLHGRDHFLNWTPETHTRTDKLTRDYLDEHLKRR